MESVLGRVNALSGKVRRVILRNNGIRQRYYALDPATGRPTHSNAQITAEAVRMLHPRASFNLSEIALLSCGTASADQIMPGHASMVHGELGGGPCEVASLAGVCLSGLTALKYAWLAVASGDVPNAVAAGSELASTFLRAGFFSHAHAAPGDPAQDPAEGFRAEFLRWMLSDGAGAVYLEPKPRAEGLSLRVDWIDQLSFAHELETCMYAAAVKDEAGVVRGWRDFESPEAARAAGAFAIQQDVRLLNEEIIRTSADRVLKRIVEKRGLRPEEVDWFLPHYSSAYFRQRLYDGMAGIGFEVPFEKWFTNLETKGNTGAASIYIILDELFHSGRIEKGQRLLCFIPESGRFAVGYAMLTAV